MEKQTIIRRDINLSAITKEEFIKILSEDIPMAIDKHNEALNEYSKTGYVTMEPSPVPDAVPFDYFIHKENVSQNLERAFDTLIKDPNFINGIGYAITHYVDENGKSESCRSFSVEILHDEEKTAELEKVAERVTKDYIRFASPRD